MADVLFPYFSRHHLSFGSLTSGSGFTKIGECDHEPKSPLEEAIRAASEIGTVAHRKPIVLCMSGGIDSEAMAQAFLRAGVPFRVATLKFNDGLNEYDIADARAFCSVNSLDLEEIDFNIIDFLNHFRHLEFALKDSCRSPQIAVHCELMRLIDGLPIMAWNPTRLHWSEGRLHLCLPREPQLAYLRFLKRIGKDGVPFFFAYTPELIYSFFHTPVMRQRLLVPIQPTEGEALTLEQRLEAFKSLERIEYQEKVMAYRQGGFDLTARSMKATGFEGVAKYYSELWIEPQRFMSVMRDDIFNYLFRRPMEKLNPFPRSWITIVDRDRLPPSALGSVSHWQSLRQKVVAM